MLNVGIFCSGEVDSSSVGLEKEFNYIFMRYFYLFFIE